MTAGSKIVLDDNNLWVSSTNCTLNTFSTGANDDCSTCEEGTHSRAGMATCVQTQPGYYFDPASNGDFPCPVGTFAEFGATDVSGCNECEEGKVSGAGSGYCSPCEQVRDKREVI